MPIGNYRLSTEVANPGRRTAGDGAMSAMAHRVAASLPHLQTGLTPGHTGAYVAEAVDAYRVRKMKEADDAAAEAAQNLQTELGDVAIQLYQRQGLSADGLADEWAKTSNDRIKEACGDLNSMAQERLKKRMAPWLAARRANLFEHQLREVRKGKIEKLAGDLEQSVNMEVADILMQARGERSEYLENAASPYVSTPEENAKWHLEQLDAAIADKMESIQKGVEDGLFPEEHARAMVLGLRGKMLKSAVSGMIGDGSIETAEAILKTIEEDKDKYAKDYGVEAKDLVSWKDGIENVRKHNEADAKRAETEARQAARKRAVETEIGFYMGRDVPTNEIERKAYFAAMASDYKKLASDESLDEDLRRTYAKTAESLGFRLEEEKDAIVRRVKAEAAEARREAAERARERERMREAAVKENEEMLSRAIAMYNLAKMDGGISQDEKNEFQANIWRTFGEKAARGDVGAKFIKSFTSDIKMELDGQKAEAMRKLYRAFGYTGELNSSGEIPLSKMKEVAEEQFTPVSAGDGQMPAVSGADMLRLTRQFSRDLDTLKPDINKEGVVEALISKSQKGEFARGFIKQRSLGEIFWGTVRDIGTLYGQKANPGAGDGSKGDAGKDAKGDGKEEKKEEE